MTIAEILQTYVFRKNLADNRLPPAPFVMAYSLIHFRHSECPLLPPLTDSSSPVRAYFSFDQI